MEITLDVLKQLYDDINVAIFVIDILPDGDFYFIYSNSNHEKFSGIKAEQLKGKKLDELISMIPADVLNEIRGHYQDCVQKKDIVKYEEMIPMKGVNTWWKTILTPVKDRNGEVCRIIGNAISANREIKLRERIKELECNNKVNKWLNNPDIKFEEVLSKSSNLVASSFIFPDYTNCRITYNDKTFTSNNFKDSENKIKFSLKSGGNIVGLIEVFLTGKYSQDKKYFLKEEYDLLKNISTMFSVFIERNYYQNKISEQYNVIKNILDSFPAVLYVVDPETYEVLYTSKFFKEMLGTDPIGKKCHKAFQGLDAPCSFCTNNIIMKNKGKAYSWQHHNKLLDKHFIITDQIIKWVDGRDVRYEVAIDITEEKIAQKALREIESKFATLVDSAPIPLCYVDADGTIIKFNKRFSSTFGYSHNEIPTLKEWWELAYPNPEYRNWALKTWNEAVTKSSETGKDITRAEYNVTCSNGDIKRMEISGITMEGYFLATFIDMTQLRKTESLLKENKERMELATSAAQAGIWDWWTEKAEVYYSPIWKGMLGYCDSELENNFSTWEKLLHPEDREKMLKYVHDYLSNPEGQFIAEFRMKHKNGSYKWIHNRAESVRDKKNKVIRMYGAHTDITELQEARQELDKFFNVSLELLCIANTDGYFTKLNPVWKDVLGYSEEELMSKSFMEFVHPEDVDSTLKEVEKLKSGATTLNFINRYKCREGTYKWLDWTTVPVGDVLYAAARDITDIKLKESELRNKTLELERNVRKLRVSRTSALNIAQDLKETNDKLNELKEKLENSNKDLEQFAYVASHDLQEPLRMVSSFMQLLVMEYEDKLDDEAKSYIDFAVDGANRMKRLIQDLLSFSRVGTKGKSFKLIDMNIVKDTVLLNLEASIEDSGAVINFETIPDQILGDETQLVQLFQNIIGNAIKFRAKDRKPEVNITVKKTKNNWHISVKDNGIGIKKDFYEKIFVIFQRLNSRKNYEGTGIGLAICKKIVERHGGSIGIQSEEGKGTEFIIKLPNSGQ